MKEGQLRRPSFSFGRLGAGRESSHSGYGGGRVDGVGIQEHHHGEFVISTDPDRFDADVFHAYISDESYWARGRLRETTDAALPNSLVFGVYEQSGAMVGAARVVTDCATFGWLCDVFVLEDHRGLGLGKALVATVRRHPCLTDVKRLLLATGDAHSMYAALGFTPLAAPDLWMEWGGNAA